MAVNDIFHRQRRPFGHERFAGPGCSRWLLLSCTLLAGAVQADKLSDVGAIPHLHERGRAAYIEFLRAPHGRAFVIAPGGTWAWRAEMMRWSSTPVPGCGPGALCHQGGRG